MIAGPPRKFSHRGVPWLHAGNLSGKTLPVQGVDADALRAVVKALYLGQCNITLQSAGHLYDAACKLEVWDCDWNMELALLSVTWPNAHLSISRPFIIFIWYASQHGAALYGMLVSLSLQLDSHTPQVDELT